MAKKMTKEDLVIENEKLRALLFDLYCKRLKGIYVMSNGELPTEFNPSLKNTFAQFCKNKGL